MPLKNLKMQPKVNLDISSAFVKFGLSRDAGKCYQVLLESGSLTSEELARKIDVLPNAVYRLTNKLDKKGLIVSLDTYPVKFQALSPDIALSALASEQIKEIEESKTLVIQSLQTHGINNPQTKIDILTGWKSMMNKYVDLAKEAKEEILIVSIGEPVTDEIKLANRDALERGVSIKFIVHKYNQENYGLLRSWIKMGIEVRYFAESGYHLVVIDGKKCLLATSNPQNSQERTSVVIYGEGLSKAMQQYFYLLWEKSLAIKTTS